MLLLTNSLKALLELRENLNSEQVNELTQRLNSLSEQTKDAVLKSQIIELKQALASNIKNSEYAKVA